MSPALHIELLPNRKAAVWCQLPKLGYGVMAPTGALSLSTQSPPASPPPAFEVITEIPDPRLPPRMTGNRGMTRAWLAVTA